MDHGLVWPGFVVPDGIPDRDIPLPIQERLNTVPVAQLGSFNDPGLPPQCPPKGAQPLHQEVRVIPLVVANQGANEGVYSLQRYT